MGQVQNQAYGYFFPHGPFFATGHLLGLPPWVTQRIWWALLLLAGFWGMVRLAEAIGIGSRGSRIVAGVAFALSPRVITTLGSISSESLPMMLAPWMLLAPVLFGRTGRVSTTACARSAVALALMGSVNAVATAAATLPALLWLFAIRIDRRWLRFAGRWFPLLALATLWWIVPLMLLGTVSPPFLDFIESSGVTTEWASLGEVLRGTDSWTPFVSPERIAGAVLVTQPAAVLATGLLAAAGMAGLAMRSTPARGRLALILGVGLAGICAGYVGELGSPVADSVRVFLDSGGAPLRNVHKLEPLIRIPLVLGLAQLLARVPLPASVPMPRWRSAFAHPERDPMVALAGLVLVALTLATSLAWTARLAPRGAYEKVPDYWSQTAAWLARNAADTRALVVPGAPFGTQVWGLTRDEPLQALASTPWAVRDAVPLVPPGAIRAMDSVQRLIASGRPSTGLAATLAGQGIGILVLRNDLDQETSRSARPMLVHQAVEGSPGLRKVTQFGKDIGPGHVKGLVADGDLQPDYPAIEIYRVAASAEGRQARVIAGEGAQAVPGAYVADLAKVPVVQGGPEVLERLNRDGRSISPSLLAADAKRAGLPADSVIVTDTPTNRETDFGQVDNHSSAIRAPEDPRRTHNLVPDYPVPGTAQTHSTWSGARISVSSSAADATQLGGTAPGSGAASAVDGDKATSWISNGVDSALGQWLQLDLDRPIGAGLVEVTVSPAAVGSPVKWIEVGTPVGTTAARIDEPGKPVTVALPPGRTPWLRITATQTENGKAGGQFGISELSVLDYSTGAAVPVRIEHRVVVPPPPVGATVRAWDLGQELPGRSGCFDAPDRVRCSKGLALAPEELGVFERTLSVPKPTSVHPELTVRARQGPALETLLTDPVRPVARGTADIGDLRGAAFAATDGNPRTAWTAPEDTVRKPGGAKPTVTIELATPALITGLALTPSAGQLPAAPTSVTVNLGDGPQVRRLPRQSPDRAGAPTRIAVHPTVTDRIQLSLDTWKSVLDRTAFGFAQLQPAGLAEVAALGPDGRTIGGPHSDPNRVVTIGCSAGPQVAVGGVVVSTTVTATAAQLSSGGPLAATPCGPTTDIELGPGAQDVTVSPGDLFVTDRLALTTPAAPGGTMRGSALVLPLSANAGWTARVDGRELRPVVMNGWQQAWLLPTDDASSVTISFPADRWYRLGIFGGLLLLVPLCVLAVLPRRRRAPDPAALGPAPRTYRSAVCGVAGLCGVAAAIVGPIGPVITLAGAMALMLRRTVTRRVLPAVTGIGTAVSASVLSTGPWRSADGYVGGSLWVQLPALVAVVAVGLAALPRLSRSRTARRTGSSTSA